MIGLEYSRLLRIVDRFPLALEPIALEQALPPKVALWPSPLSPKTVFGLMHQLGAEQRMGIFKITRSWSPSISRVLVSALHARDEKAFLQMLKDGASKITPVDRAALAQTLAHFLGQNQITKELGPNYGHPIIQHPAITCSIVYIAVCMVLLMFFL